MELESDISENGRVISLSLVPTETCGKFRVHSKAYGRIAVKEIGLYGIRSEHKRLIAASQPDLLEEYVRLDTSFEGEGAAYDLDNCIGSAVIADGVETDITSFVEVGRNA
jgi:hypothetical protein